LALADPLLAFQVWIGNFWRWIASRGDRLLRSSHEIRRLYRMFLK
jgi:hypothetical protein